MRFFLAILLLSACQAPAQRLPVQKFQQGIHKTDTFQRYAVVSAHPLASQAGALMLAQGGNAFDAAVATQLALAVVYPNAGNLGGGGFLLGRKAADKSLVCLDYRETAPAAARRDMYLDSAGNFHNQLSLNGHLAAGIPGTPAGLNATLPHCKLKWAQLIEPALVLARDGFLITDREARGLNATRADFMAYNTRPTAFVRSQPWVAGERLKQPELAATLQRMKQGGTKEFYEGITANLIVEEMLRGKGLVTREDLAAYKAKPRRPLQFSYRGHSIIGFPPPSSGGLLLAQMLGMLEAYPLSPADFHTPATVHLMAEVERRAYADRAAHMGDPDFYEVPVAALMSRAYLRQRQASINPEQATPSRDLGAGKVGRPSEQTTHISIVDAEGNMVSVTTTLNNSYGSKTVVGGAGFLLNDEMDDFSAKPGAPNLYGAVGGEANAIAPGKRMLSSMTPTLVLRQDKPFLVVGTPGGTTIPTSVFQSIVNVIDFQMNGYDAVNLPKFHHQWLPDQLFIEKGFPQPVRQALGQMGHRMEERGAIGRTELIRLLPDGRLEATADNRGDDAVAGK